MARTALTDRFVAAVRPAARAVFFDSKARGLALRAAPSGTKTWAFVTPAVPTHPDATARQVAPQIAAALLTKPRAELTVRQAEVVDALKIGCPGYAQMRALMLAFRSILRTPPQPAAAGSPARSTAALHRWLDRAQGSGIDLIQAFVGQLRRDVRAVDAAVTSAWSNGQVEGQVNRLKPSSARCTGGPVSNSSGLA